MIERLQKIDFLGRFLRATGHLYDASSWYMWLAAFGLAVSMLVIGQQIVRRRSRSQRRG